MQFIGDEVLDVVTSRLPAAGIDCIMIGGHAVNHYGVLRATQDIDFMIAAADEEGVRRIMSEAGFTNVASHETVIFFQRPGSPMRVDFLKVDGQTMSQLLQSAIDTSYFKGRSVRVPCLRDLIAMKLFAMGAGRQREEKDSFDVVHLVVENGFDVENDLRALCLRYATPALYERLREWIGALTRA